MRKIVHYTGMPLDTKIVEITKFILGKNPFFLCMRYLQYR